MHKYQRRKERTIDENYSSMNTTEPSARMRNDTTAWTVIFCAWFVASVSTLGALFVSEVMQLPPCVLCWYQRIFMFPLVLILPIGPPRAAVALGPRSRGRRPRAIMSRGPGPRPGRPPPDGARVGSMAAPQERSTPGSEVSRPGHGGHQPGPDGKARPVKTGLPRLRGQVERLGGRLGREPLDVAQEQDGAVGLG